MKKIINGKKYDTSTAKEIGIASANCSYSDFSYWSEVLYQKKTGEFFIHGEGGANSKYSCYEGGMYCWGESIVPISINDAKKWAEKYMTAEEYEELFGEVEE